MKKDLQTFMYQLRIQADVEVVEMVSTAEKSYMFRIQKYSLNHDDILKNWPYSREMTLKMQQK